ncbi:MAG: oxygenase MpaB family protein [Terracidiphilus sp.]
MEPEPSSESPAVVTSSDLESLLAAVEHKVAYPLGGIFGADSISWTINRESALFLAAGRAALLQLAHPWVAVALAQHSSLLRDPIARFHNTFRIVFTMIFGTSSQAFAASRSLHQLHTRIRGQIPASVAGYPQGSHYEANQIDALRWVYATLVESAIFAYECVLSPLNPAARDAYYAESRTLASLFGIPPTALPPDWASFTAYISAMCESQALGVDELSRSMAQNLLAGSGSWIHPPTWYGALTTAWIPPRFREEFRLTFGPAEQRAAQTARHWLPRLYRCLPSAIRYVGPYQEACARLDHRPPGPLTRRSNRFWFGQTRLPFGD